VTKEKDRTKEIPDTEEAGPPEAPDALDELRGLAAAQGLTVKKDANLNELLEALDPSRDMTEDLSWAVSKILERVRACEEKLSADALKAQDPRDSDPNP